MTSKYSLSLFFRRRKDLILFISSTINIDNNIGVTKVSILYNHDILLVINLNDIYIYIFKLQEK
jgi:hypothetical protein